MMYALINATIHTGLNCLIHHAVLIDGARILDVVPLAQLSSECRQIDLSGQHLSPGFIDLQINGCGGVMFNDAIAPSTLDTMHQTNLKSGTTSFLPTLITTCDDDMIQAMDVVANYQKRHPNNVLGLHLEGPYLNPKRKGIHNESHIRQLDAAMLRRIAQHGRAPVMLLTLAPECVDAKDIRYLSEQGIVISAGHTDATFEQGMAGFDAGVRMATHLFNAMSPWLSRTPGMVGAVLSRNDVYAGIIADGEHVHFASIRLVKALKQAKLILVTDATPPVGSDLDSFWIGGQEVFYQNGRCVSQDGTLGGSALTMIEAIANCVHHVAIPLDEALRMASTYPAQLLGIDHELGQIASDYWANLAVFDHNFQMTAVVDQGEYQSLVT
jgi:N-acetylglucosamine-6-phosphate deacetylase